MAQSLRASLLLWKTRVQFPGLTWVPRTACNSSTRTSRALHAHARAHTQTSIHDVSKDESKPAVKRQRQAAF